MAAESTEPIRIELELPSDDKQLLAGLEAWLQLGLLSPEQVRALCAERLSCAWFAPVEADGFPSQASPPLPSSSPDFAPPDSRPPVPATAPVRGWLGQLVGELSVVWLLGLGVFLVVLSSAVLAATQWAQFQAVGQYLVLFTYTLIFWAAGLWGEQNPHLQLTAKTLQVITLLLVPLNYWAMDGLGVGRDSGWLVVIGAGGLLGLIAYRLLGQWSASLAQRGLFLGLGLLQLGWGLSGMPTVAAYVGAAATGGLLLGRRPDSAQAGLDWPLLLLNLSLGMLLLRALAGLDPSDWGQLGLAFGLYGAAWGRLGQHAQSELDGTEGKSNGEITGAKAALWSRRLGQGLLAWGWLICLEEWPAQALAISCLGLGLRLLRLLSQPQRRNLLMAFAIALQLPFLTWQLLPAGIQQGLVSPLASWLETPENPNWLLGVSLYPYVVMLIAIADSYHQHDRPAMARFSERLALGFNALLSAFSVFAPAVLVVNLIASTIAAFTVTLRRPASRRRIYTSHGLALISIFVTIGHRWPALGDEPWLLVVFSLMAVNLLLSGWLPGLWSHSSWLFGLGLAGVAYALLWQHLLEESFQSGYSLLGLTIPLLLNLLRRPRWSLLAVGLTAPLTWGMATTRLAGLGSSAGLAAANSYLRGQLLTMLVTVGLGLGFVLSLIGDGLPGFPSRYSQWYWVLALLAAVLWALGEQLGTLQTAAARLYAQACDYWSRGLAGGLLAGLTVEAGRLYLGWRAGSADLKTALGLLVATLLLRSWRRPQPWTTYLTGWGIELLLAELVNERLALAVVTIGLGAATLGLTWLLRSQQPQLLPHLRILSLLYGLLGLGLRLDHFTAWTGWSVLATALLGLEISRQIQHRGLRWLALAAITLGWYELVLYQLSLAEQTHPADGVVILATVAVIIMAAYRFSASWLGTHLDLPETEMMIAAHVHWGAASVMMAIAGGLLPSGSNLWGLGLGLGLGLVGYGLWQGRGPEAPAGWVYAGLIELTGWFVYLRLALPALAVFDSWWAGVACAFAALFYWGPWQHYGWSATAWQRFAIALPPAIALLTGAWEHVPTLAILALLYAGFSTAERSVRLSYLAAAAATWAVWVGLEQQAISDSLAYVLPLGLTGLYAAQLDPDLQASANREGRHWLRVLSLGLILGVALISDRWTGLPAGGMGLVVIALGLWRRVRAYLYVGTVVFGLNALNQLIWLNAEFPLIKWVIGIVVGIGLIWIAADFERRRGQWIDLSQSWLEQLQAWE